MLLQTAVRRRLMSVGGRRKERRARFGGLEALEPRQLLAAAVVGGYHMAGLHSDRADGFASSYGTVVGSSSMEAVVTTVGQSNGQTPGTVIEPNGTVGSATFTLASDGVMSIGNNNTFYVAKGNAVAVGAPVPGSGTNETGLMLLGKYGSGLSNSTFSGNYHALSLSTEHLGWDSGIVDGRRLFRSSAGSATANGAGSFSGSWTNEYMSNGGNDLGSFGPLNYSVAANGKLSVWESSINAADVGFVTPDGNLGVVAATEANGWASDEQTFLGVLIKKSTNMTLSTLAGHYHFVQYAFHSYTSIDSATGYFDINSNGSFTGLTQAVVHGNTADWLDAPDGHGGQFSVTANGRISISGLPELIGFASPDGNYLAFYTGDSSGPEAGMMFMVRDATSPNVAPVGSLDACDRSSMSGWAFDGDAGTGAIEGEFYIDGVRSGEFTADMSRPDLAGGLGSPDHGFHVDMPDMNGDAHTVEVYVVDAGTGSAVLIGSGSIAAVVAPTFTISSTDLSASFGQAITLSADFTGGTFTPTGNVQFYDGSALLGPANIDANGHASMTFSYLQPGAHTITAQFAGDGHVGPLTSNALAQTVGTPAQAGALVARYRLYSPVTQEHLYTTDANEYAVLATYGWTQEGMSHQIFNAPASIDGISTSPLFRLYNTSNMQHLWTIDANEYNTLRLFAHWNAEGVDGYVFGQTVTGAIPLYRLNYPYGGLNYHHWTADENEYNVLPGQQGWVQEGISAYVLAVPTPLPAPEGTPGNGLAKMTTVAWAAPVTEGFLREALALVG